MASEQVVEVTDDNFEEEVANAATPVLVDFWAEWCMPCRMVAPVVQELAGEYAGQVKFGKMDVDSNRGVASKLGLSAIPTLIIFKDGQPARKIVGVRSKKDLKAEIDAVLS